MKAGFKGLIFLVFVVVPNASVVNAELRAYWNLDEGEGNFAVDSSGNGHSGALHGDPKWVTGKVGGALNFDGVDDFIHVDTIIVQGSFSFACWLRYNKVGGWAIMRNDVWEKSSVSLDLMGKAKFRVAVHKMEKGKPSRVISETSLAQSEWNHLVATYDTVTKVARMYVNGQLDQEQKGFLRIRPRVGPMGIGVGEGGQRFDGTMDEVCIFNHALNENEVLQLFNQGAMVFVPPSILELVSAVQKAKSIQKKQGSEKGIPFIEEKISEYERWKDEEPNDVNVGHERLACSLYFLLAEAKKASGAPAEDIIGAYKQSISQLLFQPYYVPAFLWLTKNAQAADYTDVVKKSLGNQGTLDRDVRIITERFESAGNWPAFESFLDIVFADANETGTIKYAGAVERGLEKDREWAEEFSKYCRRNAELTQYVIETKEQSAKQCLQQEDFSKAAEIYREIANLCRSEQDKAIYELKASECIFNAGQYADAVSELTNLIEKYESVNNAVARQATVLKGRAYLHLKELDQASDTFLDLIVKHPEMKQAPEVTFFIGYCKMLQGKQKEAAELLSLVVKDFPTSSYASKARLYLARMKEE